MQYRRSDAYFRVVRSDCDGHFVLWENKVFRPLSPSSFDVGVKVLIEEYSWDHGNAIEVCERPGWINRGEKWIIVKRKPEGHYHCDC